MDEGPTYWLSYGAGVNSTALLIMLARGELPQYRPFRVVFADTMTEREETYGYLYRQIMPWAQRHGICIEVVRGKEGVLERWERLSVMGSRRIRACTVEAKINPINRHIHAHTIRSEAVQLIGIHAAEAHRAKRRDDDKFPEVFPLVDLDLDQDDCKKIISDEGLCIPFKSGCWCCPFMRVGEVLSLARDHPDMFNRIATLEQAATQKHGRPCHQWGDHQCDYWKARAAQGTFDEEYDENDSLPCECFSA